MPKTETTTDYSSLRVELEARLKNLLERADSMDDQLSEPPPQDWDENAIESEQDEVLEGLGRAAVEEVRQIREALSRIDSGNYGSCSECGSEIPGERLEALPFATCCVKCA